MQKTPVKNTAFTGGFRTGRKKMAGVVQGRREGVGSGAAGTYETGTEDKSCSIQYLCLTN